MEMRLAFERFRPRVRGWLDQVRMSSVGPVPPSGGKALVRVLPQGAVAILGDAAHPTLPFLAQGAMGLEDGWLLAAPVTRADTLAEALAGLWQALRRPRCARIVTA
jgi:salicylate hydroxylase